MGVVSFGKSELCGQSEWSKNRERGKQDDHILYFPNLAISDHTVGDHPFLERDRKTETGLGRAKKGHGYPVPLRIKPPGQKPQTVRPVPFYKLKKSAS